VDSDCDDGDPCTDDKCEAKQCFFWELPKCCSLDSDCDDGNDCTTEECLNSKCTEPKYKPGCCKDAGQCNDQDPCTIDKCENSKCVYSEKEECCHADNECPAMLDCEIPHCVNGNCVTELGPDCCYDDGDCDDNDDACTIDKCDANHCKYVLKDEVGCCLTSDDCDAVDPCLTAICKPNHECEYSPIPGCCKDDETCDDSDDVCTTDKCVQNVCEHTLTDAENCCLAPEDCHVTDVCMGPTCSAEHQCVFSPVPNCCHDVTECDDLDDLCTDDSCIDNQCHHSYTGAEGCCKANADCISDDPCMTGVCKVATGTCSFDPIAGCCHNDTECNDDDDVCTIDTCVDNVCDYTFTAAPGCCEPFSWLKDFNDGSDQGFSFEGGLGFPGMEGFMPSWSVTGDCGTHSEPAALYFGITQGLMGPGCTYGFSIPGFPNMFPATGTATSEQFELPEGQTYTLKFWIMPDISDSADADSFILEVLSGSNVDEIWSKADLDAGAFGSSWTEVTIDFSSYAGKKASLRFSFDSLGGEGSGGVGVIIDDIDLNADCNP